MSEMTDAQRSIRGQNAKRALEEFFDPAIATVTAEYAARLRAIACTTPWEADKITVLANAQRIAEEVRGQIMAIVLDGAEAQGKIDRARKVEDLNLSKSQRRLLSIGAA